MCGIALHYCLAGVHPPQRLPRSRIKCGMTRDDGAMRRCTIAPLCTAAFFLLCHSGLRAGILGSLMCGIALHYCLAGVHPRRRLPGSRIKCGMTAHCAVVPSRSLCTAARTPTVSFRPPSRNPGQPYARYCVALLPRRCPSPPPPPRVPHQVRDDGALRRCAIALPLHCRSHSHSVIPASEPESWAALCAVLRCVVVIPRRRLPGSRIKCGMTAYCAAVPSRSLCTAARTPTVSFRA